MPTASPLSSVWRSARSSTSICSGAGLKTQAAAHLRLTESQRWRCTSERDSFSISPRAVRYCSRARSSDELCAALSPAISAYFEARLGLPAPT
jgi:hypothetical protein